MKNGEKIKNLPKSRTPKASITRYRRDLCINERNNVLRRREEWLSGPGRRIRI